MRTKSAANPRKKRRTISYQMNSSHLRTTGPEGLSGNKPQAPTLPRQTLKVSIVVPAYNEEKLLGASLEHIKRAMAAFHDRGWATELVVCDNNSTDRTGE